MHTRARMRALTHLTPIGNGGPFRERFSSLGDDLVSADDDWKRRSAETTPGCTCMLFAQRWSRWEEVSIRVMTRAVQIFPGAFPRIPYMCVSGAISVAAPAHAPLTGIPSLLFRVPSCSAENPEVAV